MSFRLSIPVPKELAINTNNPNVSSVVIDASAQSRRMSLRARRPVQIDNSPPAPSRTARMAPRPGRRLSPSAAAELRRRRLRFEAHLLQHDAYGAVRTRHRSVIEYCNSAEHEQQIRSTFGDESRMALLQARWEQEQQKNEEAAKLRRATERAPWIAMAFGSYSEYEVWCRREGKISVLDENGWIDDTTESEICSDDGGDDRTLRSRMPCFAE